MAQEVNQSASNLKNNWSKDEPRQCSIKSDTCSEFQDKQFLARDSLLTEVLRHENYRTVINIITVFLISFMIKEMALHFAGIQQFDLGIDLILWNFRGIGTVAVFWTGMMLSTVLFYYGFYFWASHRRKLTKISKDEDIKLWDHCSLFLSVMYMVMFLIIPSAMLLQRNLPLSSSMIILFEQVRLMMKKYAFVRSNVPKLKRKAEEKENTKYFPGESKFFYFLFAPTLIYRDSYPRSSHINWKDVIWQFLKVVAIIFCWAFIFKRLILPHYQKYGQERFSVGNILAKLLINIFPGFLLHCTGFYLLLHSWMNAFAEIMRFSDREFYKDWWSSGNYSRYLRTWNVLIADWLYVYLYKDIASLTSTKGKNNEVSAPGPFIPRLAVLIVSAVFHEYILSVTMRFFLPIQFMMFTVFGGLMTSVNRTHGNTSNILMLFSLGLGQSIMVTLYSIEWYARKNCSSQLDPFMDFITPRSWSC